MLRLIFAFLAVLTTLPVAAADMALVQKNNDGDSIYLDVASLLRGPGYIQVTAYSELQRPGRIGERSITSVMRFKCKEHMAAALSLNVYSASGAKGTLLKVMKNPNPEFQPVSQNDTKAAMLRVACGRDGA